MQYFGGKSRIAKELGQFINQQLAPGQVFVDLFCGAGNVSSQIHPDVSIHMNDSHPDLMAMWDYALSGGDFPNTVSEEEYKAARSLPSPNPIKGYIGFGCSFAGSILEDTPQVGSVTTQVTQSLVLRRKLPAWLGELLSLLALTGRWLFQKILLFIAIRHITVLQTTPQAVLTVLSFSLGPRSNLSLCSSVSMSTMSPWGLRSCGERRVERTLGGGQGE